MSKKSSLQEQLDGYRIAVTGRNVHVTDAMKNYAMEKIAKIERFTDRLIEVSVIMDIQKVEQRVEIILKSPQLKIASHAASNDMYASIDRAFERIETQLRRYKSRIKTHQARPHSVVDMEVNVFKAPTDGDLVDLNAEIEEANEKELIAAYRPRQIVSQDTYPLKTLSHEEAIMKMELSLDPFLIFRCEEDQKIKVMYRRKDENYGVVCLDNSKTR